MDLPQIVWAQAPLFFKNSGKYKIGHCEFEGTTAPSSWISYCNMMDELWVPTKWDKEKFASAGVNVPIYIIPQGIDPNYFHPNMSVIKIDEHGVVETTQGIFPLKPKVGVVLWDRRLKVDEVVEALAAHDEIAREAGYINQNGERLHKGSNN